MSPTAPPIAVAIMGPTASGKSALAMYIAGRVDAEIVSVDSAQVYRDMDIGTAKPAAAERAQVPHHLLDLVAPTEAYSAARFRSDALAAVQAIHARGRLPLLTGGTMLYFKALREGLADLPDADPALRAAIDARAARLGWPALHAQLRDIDPETAARLQPGDAQRIQRALELHHLTGRAPSALYREQVAQPLPFRLLEIALEPADRPALHQRIAQRFESMLAAGLVDELAALRGRHALTEGLPSMRAVGYRQAWEFLEGRLDHTGLRERGIFATRQLAKRQLTWLRPLPAARFDCLSPALHDQVWSWLAPALERMT